jgi:hypothetical protein
MARSAAQFERGKIVDDRGDRALPVVGVMQADQRGAVLVVAGRKGRQK